jgi:hypothetical protein
MDNELLEYMQTLYQDVYGMQPDNGTVSHEFFKAAMYSKRGKDTNWAKHATAVYTKMIANAAKKTWKLQPPCLPKQLRGLVDEVAAALQALRESKCSNLSAATEPSTMMGSASSSVQAITPPQPTSGPVKSPEQTSHDLQATFREVVATAKGLYSLQSQTVAVLEDAYVFFQFPKFLAY